MKAIHLLIIILFFTTPLYAQQALVLTEIEQIQEKIWYLQRDLAAMQTSVKNQQKAVADLNQTMVETSGQQAARLDTVEETTVNLRETMQQLQAQLQQLNETLFELSENVDQKDSTILDMAGKAGALEGSLKELREELNAQQTRHERALAEMRDQLGQTRTQLEALKESKKGLDNQAILWAGAAVLAAAILLTAVIAFKGGRRKQADLDARPPSQHEL